MAGLLQPSSAGWFYIGVYLISASVLMAELILTRIFSVKLYYHYAFMVVSLALFGSGASGVFVYALPSFFTREALARHLLWFGAAFTLSLPVALYWILELDFQLQFSLSLIGQFALLYSIPAIPFFLGGTCLSLAMTHRATDANRIYCCDLVGAGTGCLLVIPLLDALGGINALLAVAVLGALATVAFSFLLPSRKAHWAAGITLTLVAILLIVGVCDPFLRIRQVKGREEGEPLFSKWNSFSRITVVQVNKDPKNTWVIMDGDAGTILPDFNGDLRPWHYLRGTVSALAYHLKPQSKVLVIGPGGGIDILTALVFGSRDITGVEINPITVNDVMMDRFRQFTGGLYARPEVRIVVDEGRNFIRKSQEQYDIIQATLVDTWAATAAGAFSLTENNLYTVEAFSDYLSKLKPDGLLTMTRWNLEPPQQDLRLVSLALAAMARAGIDQPERHLMLLRQKRDKEAVECSFLFKKSEFSEAEVHLIESLCQRYPLEILYTPRTAQDNAFSKLIRSPDPEDFYRTYPFDVSPPTDNKPFFFHTVRLRQLWNSLFLSWESKKTNVGVLVLYLIFFVTLLLVILFILVPMAWRRTAAGISFNSAAVLRTLGYFVCLGLGFILVEMTLVQKFMLYLGNPVYALAVVFFSLLVSSGLGSLWAKRFDVTALRHRAQRACFAIAAVLFVYLCSFHLLLYGPTGLSPLQKALLVVLCLLPPGFLMGMPMPLAVRWLHRNAAAIVPWAWGLNGAASVLGSVVMFLLAVHFGFDTALLSGLSLYVLAAFLLPASISPVFRADNVPEADPHQT
ncbi:MAG: hypothetical protein AB1898_02430 [Acidobacteriota bacterium]